MGLLSSPKKLAPDLKNSVQDKKSRIKIEGKPVSSPKKLAPDLKNSVQDKKSRIKIEGKPEQNLAIFGLSELNKSQKE
ncbi:hypothetical protein BLX88_22250 [Bacillus obstructivus]|nr:hypothetical protein BLX88_22250 [Bacillus obstructivus]